MTRITQLFRRKLQFFLALIFIALVVLGLLAGRNVTPVSAAPLVSSATAKAMRHSAYLFAQNRNEDVDRWGEITIAQPKVWQYERVNALLDGLLRDVEGVSLADLTQLDPNKQNAAAIRFVQSALGISVQYNQADQVNASNTLQTWNLKHDSEVKQLDEYNNYMQGLTTQRDGLTRELFATNNQIVRLQTKKEQGGAFTATDAAELQAATDRATTLNGQLKDVNSMISSAGTAPSLSSPPSVTATSATAPALPNQLALGDMLKSLPDSVQKSIANALQSPTYPATKQLDSFITLLHERLAREISVMQDDLIRDPDTFAYLVQFDVGLYPSNKSKNHMARVEFKLVNCAGCKVYSLYPGQSSYNVANYQGSSKRRSFMGNIATLIGLGISANYQRQEDTLKGSLVQSVYISGFQDDTEAAETPNVNQRFGWYYNAAPFDELIAPGIRSTFAIITVPRQTIQRELGKRMSAGRPYPLSFSIAGTWPRRDKPADQIGVVEHDVNVNLPGTKDLIELPASVTDDSQRLHVLRIEYNTVRFTRSAPAADQPTSTPSPTPTPTPTPSSAYISPNGCKKDECATVLLTLDVPIDPNLVVTVHGTPLHRVRDWRGRATSVLPPVQSLSDIAPPPTGAPTPKSETVASRSLLETDQLEPNSWFAVNSHDLLLTISHDVAGEEIFPVIQISDPGKRTLVIPNDLRQNFSEVIFDGFRLLPATNEAFGRYLQINFSHGYAPPVAGQSDAAPFQGGPYPYSTFTPLFQPSLIGEEFYAFVGQTGEDMIIGFKDRLGGAKSSRSDYSFLESRTSVILEDADLDLAWSLSCANQGEELVCRLPIYSIKEGYKQLLKACPKIKTNEETCPSISGLLKALRDPDHYKELGKMAFVPNLQVWVGQVDPEGKNSFWSPGPTKVGLFPLGNNFVQNTSFKPWHFDPIYTTADQFSIEACNYLDPDLKKVKIKYLTPLDYPPNLASDLLPLANPDVPSCASVRLPTLSLQFPEIVVQTKLDYGAKWTDAIPISTLRPRFGTAVVKPIFDPTVTGDKPQKIAGWDIKIPINRAHCHDFIDFPPGFEEELQKAVKAAAPHLGNDLGKKRKAFEWLFGATPLKWDPTHLNNEDFNERIFISDNNDHCLKDWWQNESTGRIQLHFTVPKPFIGMLPAEIPLIRTNHEQVSIPVAKLPDLRKLVLPSKLKVVLIGGSEFALQGRNAGVIDAVLVQNGKTIKRYQTAAAVDVVLINAVQPDTSADGQAGKKGPQTKKPATPPPATPPSGGAATTPPAPPVAGSAATLPSTTPPPARAATHPPATPPPAGAATSTAKPKDVPLDAGTYTVVPLVYDGKNYIPIEVIDEQGKALTYTVPAKKEAADAKKTPEPDVTVTITKTTKRKATAAPTPTPTPAK